MSTVEQLQTLIDHIQKYGYPRNDTIFKTYYHTVSLEDAIDEAIATIINGEEPENWGY